jgi:ATP-dependent Clp protease ATP-binding subunit ClpA
MAWLKSFWSLSAEPVPANFTPRAQQVLANAHEEARRLKHNFIGTEHLLLGLVNVGRSIAVNVLQNMGVTVEDVRREVEKQVGQGSDQKVPDQICYTPRLKKALALAAKESKAFNHTYVGTEHILLGLLREGDGVAPRVLKDLGVDIETTRQNILKELDPNYSPPPQKEPMPQNPKPEREPIDLTRRYDVYCWEGDQEMVYRNVLFKGIKTLFKQKDFDPFADFMELQDADGQTIFIARTAIKKFREHTQTNSLSAKSTSSN